MAFYTSYDTIAVYFTYQNLDAALIAGNFPLSMTASALNTLIQSQSEYIDGLLRPAGYQVPLALIPNQIQEVCSYLVVEKLLTRSNQQIPDTIKRATQMARATLQGLQDKTISLEGLNQNPAIGTGGHIASPTCTTGLNQFGYVRYFDRKSWGNSGQ